ncbi:hypothetical protein [Variovorax ginsengisoli]|uniref:Zn-dependent protease with chaperone function n=1 Tax=Variovorax ginsengisoli TaxID=363844 RepID=A0ABT9S2M7_9BURK|nr:hypothetical protein [Variovorax ginsengisoli]MDP9898600.1 Zn-dependent protease with chaperone function [Variovorax ginsengisoli]
MSAFSFVDHLLNFALPALFVALVVAFVSRFTLPRRPSAPAFWRQVALNSAVGLLALEAGLLLFGRDGKMLTYAALVVGCGTCQWWMSRAFRR